MRKNFKMNKKNVYLKKIIDNNELNNLKSNLISRTLWLKKMVIEKNDKVNTSNLDNFLEIIKNEKTEDFINYMYSYIINHTNIKASDIFPNPINEDNQ